MTQIIKRKVVAVLPAYNAARTLENTVDDIPRDLVDDIIVVDDASSDRTVEIARGLGLKTYVHPNNRGYGGNQKTCYRHALDLGADIVVMVHPDHQYDPKTIPQLLEPIIRGECDAVFGSRMMLKGAALKGGMPPWKYLANKILTIIENFFLRIHLTEYHSGFRAYTRRVLENVPFERNSDDFVFDTQIIIQMVAKKFTIHEIPISTRYFEGCSSVNFPRSCKYGLDILASMLHYQLYRWGGIGEFRYKK